LPQISQISTDQGKNKNLFTADLRGSTRIKSKGLYRKGAKERKGNQEPTKIPIL
jgi:hypothetical protein